MYCSSFFKKNVQQQSDIVCELVQYAPSLEHDLRFQNKLVPYKCKTNRLKIRTFHRLLRSLTKTVE